MAAHRGEPTRRRPLTPLLILLLLMLLGFALRAHNLDAFSFWTDEGLTPARSGYALSQILRNEIVIQGIVTKDTHPPLYYLVIHLTRQLFGASDFAFRYPSVLFGVLLIPLIYKLGRRMGGRTVGMLVALLAAVNPLQVYYSQEARMYTLLVLLVTGMSYVLWQAIDQIRDTKYEKRNTGSFLISPAGGLLLYMLFAALAFYTHYTVAFLIAVQGLFWAWVLWRSGLKWVIIAAAAVAVLVAVPLIPYTIPRLLSGAEANYFYVSPLTMFLDVVRFFNLGLTADFGRPFAVALNVLAFGLLLLGVRAAARYEIRNTKYDRTVPDSSFVVRHSSIIRPVFLLSWLLAVAFGLMAGSILFKPMYQGVRHIMAGSPAFLLLLAFGLAGFKMREARGERRTTSRRLSRILYPFLIFLILAGSAVALFNLYANPAYAKDDFRAIVRFIETRAGDRDVIVYNNAVLLPLHEHYRRRDDIAVTALPVYPQMATGREPELAALARDYERVWFITDPPADKRDEEKLIQGWLDANLTETINRLFPARTTEARAIAYSTDRSAPPIAPAGSSDQPCALSSLLPCSLSGFPVLASVAFDSPLALPSLWVDLVWEGERPAANNSLVFTLSDPDGKERLREARPILPDDDTRWDDSAPNHLSYDIPLPPGLPPGSYTLSVAPEGNEPLTLGVVDVAPTSAWPTAPETLFAGLRDADGRHLTPAGRPVAVFANGLELAGIVPWDDAVLPGNTLPVTLFWRVGLDGVDLSDLRYLLEVVDSRGNVLRSQEDRPGASWLEQMPAGALLREDTGLYIRPDSRPGDYRLRWTLLNGDTPLGEPVIRGRIAVESWPLETAVPAAPYSVAAEFGPTIRLPAYYMGVPTDGLLDLTFYWQAQAVPERDYAVFVHLVNEAGEIVAQVDSIPAGGTRPTTGWRAREVITDSHNLPIPADLPPGPYRVYLGLYDPAGGTRPSVTLDGAPQPDNQLLLTTLHLPEDAQ